MIVLSAMRTCIPWDLIIAFQLSNRDYYSFQDEYMSQTKVS